MGMFAAAMGGEKREHWTHLFIDEAAQAREPETLIPLMVVRPQDGGVKVVLTGDSNQLGPIVLSLHARERGLSKSWFERLLARDVYSKHNTSRTYLLGSGGEKGYRPPFVNLVRNYRSHPGILMMPSAMFYSETLRAEAANTHTLTTWTGLPNSKIPVLFHPSKGSDVCVPDTHSQWYNPSEIAITVDLIQNVLNNTQGTSVVPSEIGVICAFREHVVRLRLELRKRNLSAVNVGVVENFQGAEQRIIFLNCVRSTPRHLKSDQHFGRGVINSRRRFNVAITRAKELMVIVGNPETLKSDPFWRYYLGFVIRNGLSVEPIAVLDDLSKPKVSELESAMLYKEMVDDSQRPLGPGTGWEEGEGQLYRSMEEYYAVNGHGDQGGE
jgi:helicase MOV-10